MWAVGCIFAELIAKKPLMPGKTDPEQLHYIFKTFGYPTNEQFPGWKKLPGAKNTQEFEKYKKSKLRSLMKDCFNPDSAQQGLDLLQKMLLYDPSKRISAVDALRHPYFFTNPLPATKSSMPSFSPYVHQNRQSG